MFAPTDILQLTSDMASHSAKRHTMIAENIAHADTPGYIAKDLKPFSEIYRLAQDRNVSPSTIGSQGVIALETPSGVSPNGNTVSLEQQMMLSSEVQNDHALALMIYRKSLNMMKIAIGKNV